MAYNVKSGKKRGSGGGGKGASHGSLLGGLTFGGSMDNIVNANAGPAGSVSQRGGRSGGSHNKGRRSKSGLPNYGGSSKYNRNVSG